MANVPLKSIKFPGLSDTYTIAAQEAADIADLKSAFDDLKDGCADGTAVLTDGAIAYQIGNDLKTLNISSAPRFAKYDNGMLTYKYQSTNAGTGSRGVNYQSDSSEIAYTDDVWVEFDRTNPNQYVWFEYLLDLSGASPASGDSITISMVIKYKRDDDAEVHSQSIPLDTTKTHEIVNVSLASFLRNNLGSTAYSHLTEVSFYGITTSSITITTGLSITLNIKGVYDHPADGINLQEKYAYVKAKSESAYDNALDAIGHANEDENAIVEINDRLGSQLMAYTQYDLADVPTQNGKTSTDVGSVISITESTSWFYKKIDCSAFDEVDITVRVGTNPGSYHLYAFTDADDIVLSFKNEATAEAVHIETYHVSVPEDAKYLYILSYNKKIFDLKTYTTESVKSAIDDFDEETLKADRARFDSEFLYISYSIVLASGCSVNTKEMYIWAATHGYNAIKGDVRPTSDGKLIMCHDAGFTLNSSGDIVSYDSENNTPIHDLTYDECIALKHADTGQYVCGINDMLFVCKKYGKIAYITVRDEYIDTIVSDTLAALDLFRMRDHCIINSFTVETLQAFRAADKHIMLSNVMPSTHVLESVDIDTVDRLGNCVICAADYPSSSIDRIPASVLQYARSKNVRVYDAGLNDVSQLDGLIYKGISGVQMTALI